jgi:hypothetical protein
MGSKVKPCPFIQRIANLDMFVLRTLYPTLATASVTESLVLPITSSNP